jgi:hypothetical protein
MIQECPEGSELSFESPYCCGTCVPAEQILCENSGGFWDESACGHTSCGDQLACEAIIPGCNCGPTMAWVDGEGCVGDPSCVGSSCIGPGGVTIPDGESFPADDGCNTCFCSDGEIACTLAYCVDECWGAWTDENGTCRAPNDGIYPSECCAPQAMCEGTGGEWDPMSCGDYECGQFPACDALIPGCNCGAEAIFDPSLGCVEAPDQCTTYTEGESFPSGDGCNWCGCYEGQILCTEMACEQSP